MSDSFNRVLVWSPLPSAAGVAATSVIGQPNFTSSDSNGGGAMSASTVRFRLASTSSRRASSSRTRPITAF